MASAMLEDTDEMKQVKSEIEEVKAEIKQVKAELQQPGLSDSDKGYMRQRELKLLELLSNLKQEKVKLMDQQPAAATVAGAGVAGSPGSATTCPRIAYDDSSRYLRQLLGEPLEQAPDLSALRDFLQTKLTKPLVCSDATYHAALAADYSLAKEMLTPMSREPMAQKLSTVVTSVLEGELRDVDAETMLIGDVDNLFLRMFNLGLKAGLLGFKYARNVKDNTSGTTVSRKRPDFLLWIKGALLLKGEEKKNANLLAEGLRDLVTKMTQTWNSNIYGACKYMFAYVVAGYSLEIDSIQNGRRQELFSADMRTLIGKLHALRAVVNMMRVLRAMLRDLPLIPWGLLEAYTRKHNDTEIARITNMGDTVKKELLLFDVYHKKFATLDFLRTLYVKTQDSPHLVHAKKVALERNRTTVKIITYPVGVACDDLGTTLTDNDVKQAIKAAVQGCGELHALDYVHRDVRWPNIVKVASDYILIDLECAGVLDAVCVGEPYPLPKWSCPTGGTVLESNNTYSARSDLKMIGKMMAQVQDRLDVRGQSLQQRLQDGEYSSAAAVLEHEWFQTS